MSHDPKSWKSIDWKVMPGRRAEPHTLFSQWIIQNGFSNRSLARILGCHYTTISDLRTGKRNFSPMLRRLLTALYPSCPVSKSGEQQVFERALPSPAPEKKPLVQRVAARAARAAYYQGQSARAKKSQD